MTKVILALFFSRQGFCATITVGKTEKELLKTKYIILTRLVQVPGTHAKSSVTCHYPGFTLT